MTSNLTSLRGQISTIQSGRGEKQRPSPKFSRSTSDPPKVARICFPSKTRPKLTTKRAEESDIGLTRSTIDSLRRLGSTERTGRRSSGTWELGPESRYTLTLRSSAIASWKNLTLREPNAWQFLTARLMVPQPSSLRRTNSNNSSRLLGRIPSRNQVPCCTRSEIRLSRDKGEDPTSKCIDLNL